MRTGTPTPGRRATGDRGSTSLELVIVFPVVLLIIGVIIEGALYYHARNVALAAAQEGLRAERVESGTVSDGAARSRQFIDAAGGTEVITGVRITPFRGATRASITVTGHAPSIVPGLRLPQITQTAQGAVERFTTGP